MALGFLNKGNPRQSTLYDFSLVTRAVIYVYDYRDQGKLSAVTGLKELAKLPVQINPAGYSRNKFNKAMEPVKPDEKVDFKSLSLGSIGSKENSINVSLTFDISDEYMAISNNGILAYDVDINSATIINQLYEYANPGYLTLFKWGPLNYLSRISSLSCNYEKFSPYGEPLKAQVDVTFAKFMPEAGFYSDDDPSKVIGKTNWTAVKLNQGLDSAFVIAQKALSAAANEALPAIMSAARTKPTEEYK